MENLSLLVAFSAGILSFLSPCVLPLVPVYIADLSGSLVPGASAAYHWRTLVKTLFFIAGFSLVFISLGAAAGAVGSVTVKYEWLWQKIAGAILVLFGLHLLGVLPIPWLNYERHFSVTGSISNPLKSFLMGAAFSSGWTPCIGPVLSSILALAISSQTAASGAFLMSIFSLGMAVPFLAIGFLLGKLTPLLHNLNSFVRFVSIASGILVIIIGIIIFFDFSYIINGALNQFLPGFKGGI